jgi:mannose/cellobiose epimerase-like protein (N-acyl-D-glucosamine 2-epimerase family)
VLDSQTARTAELDRLLRFARRAAPDGRAPFGYLDARGDADLEQGYQLWITCRMTHVFGLAALQGREGAHDLAASGVDALLHRFRDPQHDGWFGRLAPDYRVVDDEKGMYEHAFVLLAATTAVRAGVAGGEELLRAAGAVIDGYFWDEQAGACRESWDRAWKRCEPYRGANSNMHTVEAFLAASEATGDQTWARRALRIAGLVAHHSREARWRLPEHFTAEWVVEPEYNRENPGDQFRPYGITIGHLFEWSRLLVQIDLAFDGAPGWVLSAATALFDTAMDIGWQADGSPGFVYTLDWQDKPVVTERMHWVAVEATLAANVLARHTGDSRYAEAEQELWPTVTPFVDAEHDGWHHELDPHGNVSTTVWSGRPDVYHAVQLMLLPDLPLSPSTASSVRRSAREA